jgi:signal transduction histidine kinase
MLEECGNLRALVNQLLLLEEGDAGLMAAHREPVRLDETIRKSVEMFSVVAENDGIVLQAPRLDPLVVQGEGQRLWQVVNNLIDNALKFTPSGGAITVELLKRDGQAILRVADTGSGIATADLPHIFERFYQADKSRQRTRHKHGSGLGLSICQTIVAAHGGTIEAASTPGAGTTITVTLPGGCLAAEKN